MTLEEAQQLISQLICPYCYCKIDQIVGLRKLCSFQHISVLQGSPQRPILRWTIEIPNSPIEISWDDDTANILYITNKHSFRNFSTTDINPFNMSYDEIVRKMNIIKVFS